MEILFTLISVVVIVVSMVLFVYLYHSIKQLLVGGTIDSGFIISDDVEGRYLILFVEYETIMLGKFGASLLNSYTLKKINLQNQSLQYEVMISRFGSGITDSFIDVFGLNDRHAFVRTYGNDLVIVDHIRGRRRCDRRRIEAKNPSLKGFKAEWCTYDNARNSILIRDTQGRSYLLDLETIIAEPADSIVGPKTDSRRKPLALNDLPSVQLSVQNLGVREPPYIAESSKGSVRFRRDKASQRYYVDICDKTSKEKRSDRDRTFLNPKVMRPDRRNGLTYLTTEPLSVIVVHSTDMKPAIDDVIVSRVSGRSEEEWRLAIKAVATRPILSEDSYLYFVEIGNTLIFIYSKAPRISVSVVDRHSGSVLCAATTFVNRQIYGLLGIRGYL
jgi:hypothetical protein